MVPNNANSSSSILMQHFQGSNHPKFNQIYTYSALLCFNQCKFIRLQTYAALSGFQPSQIQQDLYLFSTYMVPTNANLSGSIFIQHVYSSKQCKFLRLYTYPALTGFLPSQIQPNTYSALLWFKPMQIHQALKTYSAHSNHHKFIKIYTYSTISWFQPLQIHQDLYLFRTIIVPVKAYAFIKIYLYLTVLWFQSLQMHQYPYLY